MLRPALCRPFQSQTRAQTLGCKVLSIFRKKLQGRIASRPARSTPGGAHSTRTWSDLDRHPDPDCHLRFKLVNYVRGMKNYSRIAAHRGGAMEQPENTLEAFRHAISVGADEVELDIHLSADGVAVVHHDATLERMTDGHGPIGNLSLAALQRLRVAGSDSARIPTLEDALALMSSSALTLRLEIKRAADGSAYPGIIEQAVERIKAHDLDGQYYVTAFHADDLRTLSNVAADAASLLLMEEQTFHAIGGVDGLARVLELAGTHQAALPIGCLTPQLLEQAARQNVSISAFGCHSRLQIEKALHLALDVFTTDCPSLAIALRDRFQSA